MQPLFCIFFNLSAYFLGKRGGGPFAGVCPGALLFIIRPWLLSVSRLCAFSDAALYVTMWPINCPELTERHMTDQWIFTISSSSIQPSSLLPFFLSISLLRHPFTLECILPETDMLLFFLDSSHVTSNALHHYHTIPSCRVTLRFHFGHRLPQSSYSLVSSRHPPCKLLLQS